MLRLRTRSSQHAGDGPDGSTGLRQATAWWQSVVVLTALLRSVEPGEGLAVGLAQPANALGLALLVLHDVVLLAAAVRVRPQRDDRPLLHHTTHAKE